MKISLFSTFVDGGAGKAALRLHKGLKLLGEDSTMFVKYKSSPAHDVIRLQNPEVNNALFESINQKYFMENIYEGNTMTSIMYPSIGFNYLEQFRDVDIINLHWISSFISLEAIAKLAKMGIPLVWTLHDQNPMSGACHYTHGCEKYKSNCDHCPQLRGGVQDIPRVILEAKIKHLPEDLVIVSPSRWLAQCAKDSNLLRNHRIEVIPNSLEIDIYRHGDKRTSKTRLGIPEDAKVILFGAYDLRERRKGFADLIETVKMMMETSDEKIQSLFRQKKIYILTFGHQTAIFDNIGVPYKALGYLERDEDLALAYSAADVLALASHEDNLPNIMLESLACGTPIVTFAIGGMVDVVENNVNGYLVELGDLSGFAQSLIKIMNNNGAMEKTCRKFAEDHFALEIQAKRYLELFKDIIRKPKQISRASDPPSIFPEVFNVLAGYISESYVQLQHECESEREQKNRLWEENKIIKENLGHYRGWLESVLLDTGTLSNNLKSLDIHKVAIFGTGITAKLLYKELCKADFQIQCFIDNYHKNEEHQLFGLDIHFPGWLVSDLEKIDAVIISIEGSHDQKVFEQLDDLIQGRKPILSWKQLVDQEMI